MISSYTKISKLLLSDRKAITILVILLVIDSFFVLVHGAKFIFKEEFKALFGPWVYDQFILTHDWSFPETFNYLKFGVIVYLLFRTYTAIRQPVYLAWAFVYFVALLDDSLQGHEQIGEYVSNMMGAITLFGTELNNETGIRRTDVGQLIVFAAYGALFVSVLVVGFLWSEAPHRWIGSGFALLLGMLGFFAVVIDILHRLDSGGQIAGKMLETFEDSGEMLSISLTVALAFAVYRHFGRPSRTG